MPATQITRVDWAIVGWQSDANNGLSHYVMGSSELKEAELRYICDPEEDLFHFGPDIRFQPGPTSYEINLKTQDSRHGPVVWIAAGDSYAQALQRLFGTWTPEGESKPAAMYGPGELLGLLSPPAGEVT